MKRGLLAALGLFGFLCPLSEGGVGATPSRAETESLLWVTWTRTPGDPTVRISLEYRAHDLSGRLLMARMVSQAKDGVPPPRGEVPGSIHREVLSDRVQCGFPLRVPAGEQECLELSLAPADSFSPDEADLLSPPSFRSVQIPAELLAEEAGDPHDRAVIPELRLQDGPRRWTSWHCEAQVAGGVAWQVCDDRGRTVRSWPEGWIEAGTITVLWDGLDDAGRLTPPGRYLLRMGSPDETKTTDGEEAVLANPTGRRSPGTAPSH